MSVYAQASVALAESLFEDPFYRAITEGIGNDQARKDALALYFDYSLKEAERTGRCVVASDPSLGAAAWLFPRTPEVDAAESSAKSQFLIGAIGPQGATNYYRFVRFMAPLSSRIIPKGSWYLSIVGILPSAQGRGLGATLLADTLAEAAQCDVACYLETFTARNLRFYERLGFRCVAEHREPTTDQNYFIMRTGL